LFGTALYEDIACMIYDLIDSKRQHSNYLQNLKLIHVPVFGQPSPPSPGAGIVIKTSRYISSISDV
jgi:hypothetical protein